MLQLVNTAENNRTHLFSVPSPHAKTLHFTVLPDTTDVVHFLKDSLSSAGHTQGNKIKLSSFTIKDGACQRDTYCWTLPNLIKRCECPGCYLPVDQLVEQQALIEVFKFAFPLPLHVAIHVSVIPTCALIIPVAHMGCGVDRKIPLGTFETVRLLNHIPVVTSSLDFKRFFFFQVNYLPCKHDFIFSGASSPSWGQPMPLELRSYSATSPVCLY